MVFFCWHRQPPSGPAPGYLPQGAPPPTVAPPVGVPQMMNFVPAHPPMQPAPVVQPVVPNAQVVAPPPQGQYPPYPTYAGVQNYNSAVSLFYKLNLTLNKKYQNVIQN